MKLNSAQIEQTLDQFEGEVVLEDDPVVPQLKRIFGDHTYFLDPSGLNIVEPAEPDGGDIRLGAVVNIADWADDSGSPSLARHRLHLEPHDPQNTGLLVLL